MFIDIERVDPPTQGIQLMNQAARDELQEAANHLAYSYIKHSGAWRSLANEQWDELAEQIAQRLLGTMDQMVDEAVARLTEKKRT
jgi:hypothetical protein